MVGSRKAVINVRVATPSYKAYDVDVGPIWGQSHAETVAAEYIREHPELKWTGHWSTVGTGKSVINVRRIS